MDKMTGLKERTTRLSFAKISLVLSVILAATGAGAEESVNLQALPLNGFVDATSLEDLANMVVTDAKVPQTRNSVTQNIVVLRSEEIEQQTGNNRNIAELMRYTSGQFVNVLSRIDANWGSYAGLGPKYNTYMLDGIPVDSFVDPMSLDAWAIERIEVHKGPASVLYSNYLTMDFDGNEAPLAGTTNLILKERIETTLTRAQIGYGSYGTYNGSAFHQGRQGNLSYFFGASDERSNYSQYGAQNSWLQTVNTPNYDKLKGYGKLSYAFDRSDHTLSLFANFADHIGDMGRPNRDYKHAYGTLNLAYNNQVNDSTNVQFKAGERSYDRRFGNDNFPTSLALTGHSRTRQRIRPLDLTVGYLHTANALLTIGMDRQTVDYWTDNINPAGATVPENKADARSTGIYAQEKLQWGDWVLRAGMRRNTIDHHYALLGSVTPATRNASWSKDLWSLGARYNYSQDFSVYTNAGTSFMPPTAKQIGGTIVLPTDSGQIPNPALTPESGLGQDLGMEWHVDRLSLGARGFVNKVTSAIVNNVVNVVQAKAINAGSATAKGVELDIKQTLGNESQWFVNLTSTRTEIDNPANADQSGTDIPFVPAQVANLGAMTRVMGDLEVSTYYQWVGRYWDSTSRSGRLPFGNYGVLNLRLQHVLKQDAASRVSLFVDLNNLTNRRFDMPWGFRDPGLNAYIGLNATF